MHTRARGSCFIKRIIVCTWRVCSLQLFCLELGIKSSVWIHHADVIKSFNSERIYNWLFADCAAKIPIYQEISRLLPIKLVYTSGKKIWNIQRRSLNICVRNLMSWFRLIWGTSSRSRNRSRVILQGRTFRNSRCGQRDRVVDWYFPISSRDRPASGPSLSEEYLAEVVGSKTSVLGTKPANLILFPTLFLRRWMHPLFLPRSPHERPRNDIEGIRNCSPSRQQDALRIVKSEPLRLSPSGSAEFSAEPLSWWTNMLSILNTRSPWRAAGKRGRQRERSCNIRACNRIRKIIYRKSIRDRQINPQRLKFHGNGRDFNVSAHQIVTIKRLLAEII